jgi:hypothetical protein
MSHTAKSLKSIATGEDYKALCAAIDSRDYQTLYNSYTKLSQLLTDAGKEIEGKIDNLPRRNKDEDLQKFQKAFEQRSRTAVPQWYWIKSQIQKQNIMDGVVVSMGKMGDPLTRTPAGRLVVLSGSKAKEGDKVTFSVVSEGPKIDFGRQFELTPDSFYFLLNQEVHQQVKDSLDAIQQKLDSFPGASDADNLSQMDEMLKAMEEVRGLAPKLLDIEREKVLNRVAGFRRRLLGSMVEKLALDTVIKEEEKAIKELCPDDGAQAAALSAPGLYRSLTFRAFKEGLFKGDELRGFEEILGEHEKKMDTMESAMKFEEFKAGMSVLQPKAKLYVDGMERLFQRIQFKAKQLTNTIMNEKTDSAEAVLSKIGEAFSEKALGNELKRVFRSAEEYFDARGAATDLKARLGDTQCAAAEAIIKPYLRQTVNRAFG